MTVEKSSQALKLSDPPCDKVTFSGQGGEVSDLAEVCEVGGLVAELGGEGGVDEEEEVSKCFAHDFAFMRVTTCLKEASDKLGQGGWKGDRHGRRLRVGPGLPSFACVQMHHAKGRSACKPNAARFTVFVST